MSNPENTKSKEFSLTIKITGVIFVITMSFLFLAFTEILFYIIYKTTSSEYFENRIELMKRSSGENSGENFVFRFNYHGANQSNFIKDLQSNKQKVAIFGGSSAAGYAVPVSFENYLKSIDSDSFVFHNYAGSGEPLVGFQEELIKSFIDYYDIIIIYSGHNEIWSQIYRKSRDSQVSVIMPDGNNSVTFEDSKLAFQNLHKKILNLESYLKHPEQKESIFIQSVAFLRNKSRVVFFCTRLFYRIKRALMPLSYISTKKLPFYSTATPLFTENDKAKFVSDYESSILNIIQMLKKDQKLIISTVLSNDLYPPNLEYVNANQDQVNEWEKTIKTLLKRLETKGQRINDQDLKTLPNGAHKEYLKAVSCAGGILPVSNLALKRNCLSIARKARSLDKLPYRVLPGINEFIRTLDGKASNVYVIDPVTHLKAAPTQVDYLKFFIDFQHPSSLGHMYIASEISKILHPNKKVQLNLSNDCDNHKTRRTIKTNIGWLKRFSNSSSIDFMHKYYVGIALEHRSKCNYPSWK
jgi:hypothetical protein